MQDMMLSGPPRLLGLVVQDPIQKYNYRPDAVLVLGKLDMLVRYKIRKSVDFLENFVHKNKPHCSKVRTNRDLTRTREILTVVRKISFLENIHF